jgi:release factor glutamine methyltransferase
MTIREYRNDFIAQLEQQYGREEAESFFYLTLEDFRGMKRADLALNPQVVLSEDELPQWDFVVAQLKKETPIQYILGKTHFFGLEFEVNDNVLIPRPETEELVDWILTNNQITESTNPLKVLDVGTGSGCIAIALAKNLPRAEVSAIDVSQSALKIANRNADRNNVVVNFIEKNILETDNLSTTFDIIVSNPPYVRELEKHEIRKNVIEYEPHLALFVSDNDALIFYKKITDLAKAHLSQNGRLYFEINQYLAKETMDMLEQKGFSYLELRKDIYGNDRMILAKL